MIDAEKANYPIALMCRVLGVSRSGYYKSRAQVRPTPREEEDANLLDEIRAIHEASRGTYGVRRVVEQLRRNGRRVGKAQVARLMRADGLRGRIIPRYRSTTDSNHQRPVAENVLNRRFEAEVSASAWCADITCIATASGWVYLAAILDVRTRLIVGWSMAKHMRTELVEEALENALHWRMPAKELVHHSDRGSQYASKGYQEKLAANGITCSMNRKGNCWDNAMIESFFGTLKQEWAHHHRWDGLLDARAGIHDYIEAFYNRKRLHSALGYRTPMEVDRGVA